MAAGTPRNRWTAINRQAVVLDTSSTALNAHAAAGSRRIKICLLIAFLLLAGYVGYHFAKYHSIGIHPAWLLRRMAGAQYYDADSGVLYQGSPKLKEVAITIDDGPNPKYCPGILAALRANHCPATFFVVGVKCREYPNLLREMVKDGDEIGNHTYDHQRLRALPPHEIASELRDADADVFDVTGLHTDIMRPPGMEYDHKVLTVAKALGYRTISWSVTAKDYLKQSPDFIEKRAIDGAVNGSIILLHQDTPYTAQALPSIITGLRSKGFRLVTIGTMLKDMNAPPLDKNAPKNEPWDNGLGQE